MIIRSAEPKDLVPMLGIYNDIVLHTTTIYSYDPRTLDEQEAWLRRRFFEGFPVLLAEREGRVLGYCSYGWFRDWPGYGNTVEHSIYVHRDARRKGVGTKLLTSLIEHVESAGFHVMIASVDFENTGSIRFHESMGFKRVAEFKEVGYKFDRWLDLVFLQRILDNPAQAVEYSDLVVTLEPAFTNDAKMLIAELSKDSAARYADLGSADSGGLDLSELEQAGAAFVVGRLQGAAVACGALRPFADGIVEIKRMYVKPEASGKGIANKMLEVLERSANLMGYKRIVLETGKRQTEAISLYRQAGYTPIPCFRQPNTHASSVCFEKLL